MNKKKNNKPHKFPVAIKHALCMRASNKCTICQILTSLAAKDSQDGFINIGEAAHICAASPSGARYNSQMTKTERTNIRNGIWLCSTCHTTIDRDLALYTPKYLQELKKKHEYDSAVESNINFVAVGQETVFYGKLIKYESRNVQFCINNFLIGDLGVLTKFIEKFENVKPVDRFVLINELGYGRHIAKAPTITICENNYILSLETLDSTTLINPSEIPADLVLDDKGDLLIVNNDLTLKKGLSILPQRIKQVLSMKKGEWFLNPSLGTRIQEYCTLFNDSPILGQLIKLEVIRMSCIPYNEGLDTPLLCVSRVTQVEQLSITSDLKQATFRFNFELEGEKPWQCELLLPIQ